MTRHHRRAPLPGSGFTRPAAVDGEGLVFTLTGEDGSILRRYDFGVLPGDIGLRRELVEAVELLCGPARRWRSEDSSNRAFYATREFLVFVCAAKDSVSSVSELTPRLLEGWRESQAGQGPRRRHVSVMRHILLGTGAMSPDCTRVLRKALGRKNPAMPQPSYTLAEFGQIRSAAAGVFRGALQRIRSNLDHLDRWQRGDFLPGSRDALIGRALDSVLRTGDVPRYSRGRGRSLQHRYLTAVGGWAPQHTWARLFLTNAELFALAILLVAGEGWNRAVIDIMPVPTHDPAVADEAVIHRVDIDKARRPTHLRHSSNNVVDTGPGSPGRLMSQAIEATGPARQCLAHLGLVTDRLLICRGTSRDDGRHGFLLGVSATGARAFTQHTGHTAGTGNVSLARLRRTVLVRINGEPAQNSPQVHESVYVLRDASTVTAAADVIAQGLSDAIDHARTLTTMRMVLGGDADVLTELAGHPQLAAAVLAGQADTATAACTDFTNSPHAPAGSPCPASFLACLGCGNAIATRRHLPRLCYLHACLESLRCTVTAEIWQLDWHEHHMRLTTLLDQHTTAAERTQQLQLLNSRDRGLIDAVLRRRLDP